MRARRGARGRGGGPARRHAAGSGDRGRPADGPGRSRPAGARVRQPAGQRARARPGPSDHAARAPGRPPPARACVRRRPGHRRRARWSGCSSPSTARTARTREGRASGWPSLAGSSRPTAASCGPSRCPGQGASFVCELPLRVRTGDAGMSTRVLVVDDERQILRALRVILTKAGFEVITAERAEQALDLAATEKPDAAIVDLVLPDGDGVRGDRRDPRVEPDAHPGAVRRRRRGGEDPRAGRRRRRLRDQAVRARRAGGASERGVAAGGAAPGGGGGA